jgi:hypothetical protein
MPFNTLLLTCLYPGTSFSEKGNVVSLEPQSGEMVLFFSIDDQSNAACTLRQRLQLQGSICDLLVFRAAFSGRQIESVTLCLTELKGREVDRALEQVESVYNALSCLPSFSRPSCRITWKAYVKVNVGSPIRYNQDIAGRLKRRGLQVEVGRRADIGNFLRR